MTSKKHMLQLGRLKRNQKRCPNCHSDSAFHHAAMDLTDKMGTRYDYFWGCAGAAHATVIPYVIYQYFPKKQEGRSRARITHELGTYPTNYRGSPNKQMAGAFVHCMKCHYWAQVAQKVSWKR